VTRAPSDITAAPRILFLGAGASEPLDKMLMGEFVDTLLDDNPPAPDLLRTICTKEEDLDFLLEQLEELASKEYLFGEQWDPTWVPGSGSHKWQPKSPELYRVQEDAKRLLPWIKERVFRHYRQMLLKPRYQKSFSRLLDCIRTEKNPLVVFTTNYDPAVEEFCRLTSGWTLVDGFINDPRGAEYYWNRSAFDGFTFEPSEKVIVLFKLHGSTTWAALGNRIVKSAPVFDGGDPAFPNVMIYPATRKVAIEEPFFTAYDYLEKCLSHAEFCLVIGYSFRDYDCVMRFKAAKIANPALKVIVLDPNAANLAEDLSGRGVEIQPLPSTFPISEDQYIPRIESLLK
jgi:hypothetical protein